MTLESTADGPFLSLRLRSQKDQDLRMALQATDLSGSFDLGGWFFPKGGHTACVQCD